MERISQTISTIDKDFYLRYNEFIDSVDYPTKEKEHHQIQFQSFWKRRLDHIGKCAVSSPLTAEFESKLSHEETILYKQIYDFVSEFRNSIKKIN